MADMCFVRVLKSFGPGVLLLWLAFAPWSAAVPAVSRVGTDADDDFHWVATWTAMRQLVESYNLPPEPFVGCLYTTREICRWHPS